MSKHSRTLFVGDISVFCSEIDIYDFFRNFGMIEEVKLMKGKNNSPMGYAFLTFVDLASSQQALIADGAVFMGRAIKVSPAFHRNQHIPTSSPLIPQQDLSPKSFVNTPHLMHKSRDNRGVSESTKTAQVHFSFISQNIMFPVNEFTVKSVFSRFGPVLDVCFKKSVAHKESGGQSGYGFIHFPLSSEGIAAAVEVSKNIRQVVIEHVLYDCCLSHELETFLKKVSFAFQQLPDPPKSNNTMLCSSLTSSASSLGSPTISSSTSGQSSNQTPSRFQEFEMTKEFSIFGENSSFYFNRDGYTSY